MTDRSNRSLSVDVVAAYPFHMYHQAAQLERRDSLARLFTTYPNRFVEGVSPSLIANQVRWSAIRRSLRAITHKFDQRLNRAVIAHFDQWVSAQSSGEIVIGLSGFATRTLECAQARGALAVCDRGATHMRHQMKVLQSEADLLGVPQPVFDPWIVERELREYELADVILTPSRQTFDTFLNEGVPESKLLHLPYGVDSSIFSPDYGRMVPGRIVSVAAIGMQKGHHYLAQAYQQIAGPGISLDLVGPVADDWMIPRYIAPLGPSVRTIGAVPRSQVPNHMREAQVFCLASIQEGLALVVPQAMACGLPIVATTATGAADFVNHGVEGLLVPPADPDALAHALDQLVRDPERSREMGEAARRRVAGVPQWSRYGDQLVAGLRLRLTERDGPYGLRYDSDGGPAR